MDGYEATRTVFSRIQNLDPENASKIMGFLLIQDHGEKEMIRLAFGPESLLQSLITRAKTELGISSNISSTPSSPSPFLYHPSLSRQNSSSFPSSALSTSTNIIGSSTSSTGISTNTSRVLSKLVLPNPNFSSSSWAAPPSTFSDLHNPNDLLISPNSSSSLSYAASINAFNNQNNYGMTSLGSSSSDLIDEIQLQDQLSFLNEKNSDFLYPSLEQVSSPNSYGPNWRGSNNPSLSNGSHRRSCSVSDINLDSDPRDTGLEWKPCLYYARGFCKNGPTCRFNHGFTDSPDSPSLVGSPANFDVMEQCQELLRSQTQQQQQQMRMNTASQLLASGSLPYTSAAGKYMNFLLQQQQNDNQRAAAEALLLGEDMHRIRMERNGFSNSGGWMTDPGSRQIYLTFPADSTFREEDVSNYFSIYGPVQDVRIPYQQKRMFGFVTFLYPETVKMILAKGNPHFVGDARVLVKPYKEKAKVLDKKQQQGERGEFSPCTTPTGIDSRDPYNQQLGTRMLYENQDLLLRRKMEEQVELQQAIDLHSRRLMGLQLMDIKKHHHHRNLSMGALPPSPTQLHAFMNQAMRHPLSSPRTFESGEESHRNPAVIISTPVNQQTQHVADNVNANNGESVCDDNGKEERSNGDCEFHDRSTSGNEAIDI